VLQQIGKQPPGGREVERMLRIAVSREGRAYTAGERKAVVIEARRRIEAVIRDPRLERFFGQEGHAETNVFSHRYGNILGRIDRLFIGRRVGRRVVEVLDFKTHPVNGADELESLIGGLRHQVEEYCSALEEIFTRRPVRGYLYFTEAPYEARLVQVYGDAP
jgi:ATP-dependent exoDNAse (exonuclease V) beta subunit